MTLIGDCGVSANAFRRFWKSVSVARDDPRQYQVAQIRNVAVSAKTQVGPCPEVTPAADRDRHPRAVRGRRADRHITGGWRRGAAGRQQRCCRGWPAVSRCEHMSTDLHVVEKPRGIASAFTTRQRVLLREGSGGRARGVYRRQMIRYLVAAIVFGAAAALTRSQIWDVPTRLQITAFLLLAAGYAWFGNPASSRGVRIIGFLINAGVVIAAMSAVRWHIEGLCPGRYQPMCLPAF